MANLISNPILKVKANKARELLQELTDYGCDLELSQRKACNGKNAGELQAHLSVTRREVL